MDDAQWDEDMRAVMTLAVVEDVTEPEAMAARLGWTHERLRSAQQRVFQQIDPPRVAEFVTNHDGNPSAGEIARGLGWPKKRVEAALREIERQVREAQRRKPHFGRDDCEMLVDFVTPGLGTIARALGWPKKRVRAASAELDARFEAMRAQNPEGVQIIAEAMQKGPVDEDWAVQVLRASKAKPRKRLFLNSR